MITNPQDQSADPSTLANPLIGEIDAAHASLSPEAQEAIGRAHGILGLKPSDTSAAITPPVQPAPGIDAPSEIPGGGIKAPVMGLPGMVGVSQNDIDANQPEQALPGGISSATRTMPSIASFAPPQAGAEESGIHAVPSRSQAGHQSELARITAAPLQGSDPNAHTSADTGRSGIDQIHSKWGRVPLQILDAVGRGFFPRFEMALPGTAGHHDVLVDQASRSVGRDQESQEAEDKSKLAKANAGHMDAEATELASRPELKQAQIDLKGKDQELRTQHELNDTQRKDSDAQRKRDAADASLYQHGFKRDQDGQIVPLMPEELSGPQRDIHDAKTAQQELMSARSALVKAQQEHIPAAEALARRRLESAQASHDIALERLGLSEKTYEARYHGTEGGKALPGSILGDDGAPVGTAFQGNVRPTGTERNKADLANSAAEQISDIKSIVKNRADIFGPLAGRKTDFTMWLGSQDPDAQRFKAARTLAADHLAGVFGGRSETALHALDSAIGQFKDNPEAVSAGLDQVIKGNSVFQKAGTVKTAGSHAAEPHADGAVTEVKSQTDFDKLPKGATYMEDGKKYRKP